MRDCTNPASRSTRRCLETDGCDSRSSCSISPTERSDESSRLKMARLLGSATMANVDSIQSIYPVEYSPVKPYACMNAAIVRRGNKPAPADHDSQELAVVEELGRAIAQAIACSRPWSVLARSFRESI